jgi:hypothetical protein
MPPAEATVVALTSRLVVTVADLVWGLVALRAERRRRGSPNRSPATTEPASPTGSANEAKLDG